MIVIKKFKKILIYGNGITLYDTNKALNPDLTDDSQILSNFYDKISKNIITFCLRNIKFWDIFTGKIRKIYDDPMNNEITAMAIDINNKRCVLGDNYGRIKNYNLKNGKLLKKFQSHSCEIKFLAHSLLLNLLISVSIDNVIKIQDDTELTETELKRELTITSNNIKSITICDEYKRLAIGLSDGTIKYFDLEHLRFDSENSSNEYDPEYENVSFLTAMHNCELLFCAYTSGRCRFIIIPPSPLKFIELAQFDNYSKEDPNKRNIVTYAEFVHKDKALYVGDREGYLSCYDLSEIYELIEIEEELFQKKNQKERTSSDFIFEAENVLSPRYYSNKRSTIKITLKWVISAHKLPIKHIKYVDIMPQILITTSNDLKAKIFHTKNGEFIDELKQGSIKEKTVPIGIVYKVSDPFNTKEIDENEEIKIMRKEVQNKKLENVEEVENQHSIILY